MAGSMVASRARRHRTTSRQISLSRKANKWGRQMCGIMRPSAMDPPPLDRGSLTD